MKNQTALTTAQASTLTNNTIVAAESALRDQPWSNLAASPKHIDLSTWQLVPLLAQMIVDLLRPSGLRPDMNDNVLALALRIAHGEDASIVTHAVDDYFDEVPELLDAVVSLFAANHVPILVADCTIGLARQLLRDWAAS